MVLTFLSKTISFFVIWSPYACVSIAEAVGFIPSTPNSFYILAIPTILTKTAVCIDPLIYFGLNPQVKLKQDKVEFCFYNISTQWYRSFNISVLTTL